jgi:uncharacterized membrane protein
VADSHATAQGSPASAGSLAEQITQNVSAIAALMHEERERTSTPAQRRVERLSRIMGQPTYVVSLMLVVAAWVSFNVMAPVLGAAAFDRPPFAWLQGLLTLFAMLTSTTVLVAQNREARLEQQREHLEMQINLLTEQKVTRLISLLEELRRDLPMVHDRHDPQVSALQQTADTAQVIAALKDVGVAGEDESPQG